MAKTYKLNELSSKFHIESWMEAVSNMADKYGNRIKGYKDILAIPNVEDDDELSDKLCPAEWEEEFEEFAEKHNMRFNYKGDIVHFEDEEPQPWHGWVAHLLEVAYDVAKEGKPLTTEEYEEWESDSGMLCEAIDEVLKKEGGREKFLAIIDDLING